MENVTPEDEDFPGRLLHQAALWDNAELLEDLLHGEQIAHINSQDSWGRTPLHAAATTDNSRCLGVLLQAGADPNIPCGPRGENRTPLHLSSEHGYVSNVKLLLAHGAELVARDSNGLTPLDIAEKSEHVECMLVLKQTADAKETARQRCHASLRDTCAAGDVSLLKSLLQQLGSEAELVVNMAPSGSNTLLFVACEMGRKEMVKTLLEHNADGRIHPVTKYSPLYIACYNGRKDIVELLLKRFPELVQQHTVERWLPIHACCINGHVHVMELLLKYPYPPHLMQKFRDPTGEWEYEMPFDLNMKDVTGQNVLYVASFLGNYKMVELLLKFRLKASRIKTVKEHVQGEEEQEKSAGEILSPTRRRISDGIISIMARLNLSRAGVESQGTVGKNECHLTPLQLNVYCNNNSETALHSAVRGKHADVAGILLQCGADPNILCRQPDPVVAGSDDPGSSSVSTALVEACRNRDIGMADLLLRHSARDDDCKALRVATRNKDDILTAKLLSIKAYPDPEYKLNKAAMTEEGLPAMPQLGHTSLTYSSLFPNTSVMINWHSQQCDLSQVRKQWLIDAALNVNPKLKLNPRNQDIVLYAVTRIDLSKNSLTWLPPIIFQLPSLRYLNVAQNKIEKLPPAGDHTANMSPSRRMKTSKGTAIPERFGYSAPVLEEIYLQDNRLEHICEEIFTLPSLVTLDVSNNKLQTLPYNMWKAPKLKELNVAFNLLKELPAHPPEESQDTVSTASSTESGRCIYNDSSGDTALDLSGGMDMSAASDNEGNSTSEENLLDAHTLHAASVKAKCVQQLDITHHNIWSRSVEVTEQILHHDDENQDHCSQLSALNLAHNQFTSMPVALPCLAVNLTRLNLSYNSLRSMSHITSYPSSLKQLDLSHNQICCWPSLPQVEGIDSMEQALTACYASADYGNKSGSKLPILPGRRSLRKAILNMVCSHRRHLRLDNLRTLVLADNNLARIQLSTDDDGASSISEEEDSDWDVLNSAAGPNKSRLMFPNLSMLDISNNQLREIPHNIHELSNLSVLNISGNLDICELPPQMGLLSRLWNLNTRGCSLQEPLKSMIDSKKYKTMDVIGYLKSVLEDARPYARMKLMIVGVQGIGKTSLLEQLRQEGVGSYKKKPVEHWAKRMGNKNINVKTSRGTNMSTVGVDIGDWVFEKKIRGQSSYGPVVFRTWDFGGQREYYATHQYFLSKRSLYLVVWRIPDGQRGISEILHWLVNIQARAPNSPVLIVGTHYDMMRENYPASASEDLQQMIRDRFINIVDAEKCGLPRVLDTIEVSCKTRHNIKLLCNLIYDTVFSLRPPGSKELLLEQRVPASYLALEDVISHLAADRRNTGVDPVLNAEQYKAVVTTEMQYRYQRSFRDAAELHQATLFLHENGVLLHYDDATLKDLYFLDPQWLCDMLAHVVTIREINPFARTGVMKLDDLKHVFKSSSIGPVDTRGYIVNLLNKFEVALTWDSRTLLIPSLLPSEESMRATHTQLVRVKIPVRSRGWAVRSKKLTVSTGASTLVGNSSFYTQSPDRFQLQRPTANTPSPIKISGPSIPTEEGVDVTAALQCEVTHRLDPECSIRRLLLMSYFPSGFWSRLITRILADDAIVDIVRAFFIMPKEMVKDTRLIQLLDVRAEWVLWQTGMELRYADTTLFRMKEVLQNVKNTPIDYRQLRVKLKQEGMWGDVDLVNSSILEIYFPVDTIVIKRPIMDELGSGEPIGYQAIVLDPSPECTAQLLALAVDHIDILLEDWYPTLGTRFVHTSEGRFLVTRLVPCPRCVAASQADTDLVQHQHRGPDSWSESSIPSGALGQKLVAEVFHQAEGENQLGLHQVRKSQESYTSDGDGDSGVGPDSTGSSRMPSVEGHPVYNMDEPCHLAEEAEPLVHYSWIVEECILAAYDRKSVTCPSHGDIPLAQIAPDTIFLDLGERHLIRPDYINKGRLLGRGAFGFVFKGTCKLRGCNTYIDVAMKMLQPVQPGANARQSAVIAYKAAQGKWDRDPLQYACKAYCTARQELNILLSLRHPNIVPLVGVCTRPLALVLDLAPQGALDTTLRHYRRSGSRVGPYCLQAIILQVAKAVEYLHQQHIIYRDLKSENVLVWNMPPPCRDASDSNPVHIKLADYGISRLTLPSGTKGFGGTEGFMAPEIMRYNGEEEYTEKVDCFSFGMFIYELLTLHQPFEGHESVKECILDGGRPPLTYRETLYPSYMLDLMVLCWSQSPRDRPSASQIVSIASAPEFTHLCDTVSLNHPAPVVASAVVPIPEIGDDSMSGAELWLACSSARTDLLLATHRGWLQYCSLSMPEKATAACLVGSSVWLGDCFGQIHAYMGRDCQLLFSYALDPEAPEPCAVSSLVPLPSLQRVAVGLTNGRLFLVRSDILPTSSTMGEGSFVMTELGSSTVLHSLTAVFKDQGRVCELWCGESNGSISIFTICENIVTSHEIVNHYEPVIENINVLNLVSTHCPLYHEGDDVTVCSYVYPGCVVYQWDPATHNIVNKLDCSKLVPCSESLKSISIEEHLSPGKCQVTSMAILNTELYIGTTWGCIVVAERSTMRPITVFRPFEEEVRAIVPLLHHSAEVSSATSADTAGTPADANKKQSCPLIATVGRGYRSLIARYTDMVMTPTGVQSPMHVYHGSSLDRTGGDVRTHNMYALLWRAERWAAA